MSACHEETAVQPLGVLWKTVSESCNLACEYCYYSTCKGIPGHIEQIEDDLLEKFIKEYMEASNGIASFAWQGGEPLLAGIDFFKRVVSLQAKYAPKNTIISNSIQTNGTLITREWAAFFKKFNFLIGVSLDGPEEINDKKRVTRSGKGSFKAIMKGIKHLKNEQVEFNILTVIHEQNVDAAKEVLAFFHKEGFRYFQFIPCMEFTSQKVRQPGTFSISPQQYGDFLCDVFDVGYNDGYPSFSDRFFDNMLSVYLHQGNQVCTFQQECPKTLTLERNGDAYPCDFFIHDDFKIGNASEDSLKGLRQRLANCSFQDLKPDLPNTCQECEFLHLCHGGCPRNRNWDVDQREHRDYFCQSYRQAYRYADERMKRVAENMKKERLANMIAGSRPLPGRNDACVCGSGRKFKKCCEPITAHWYGRE